MFRYEPRRRRYLALVLGGKALLSYTYVARDRCLGFAQSEPAVVSRCGTRGRGHIGSTRTGCQVRFPHWPWPSGSSQRLAGPRSTPQSATEASSWHPGDGPWPVPARQESGRDPGLAARRWTTAQRAVGWIRGSRPPTGTTDRPPRGIGRSRDPAGARTARRATGSIPESRPSAGTGVLIDFYFGSCVAATVRNIP